MTPTIAYRSFSKRYGGVTAVDDLSLAIGPGEVVAMIGPNGSGKTTTLKAAAGLIRPTSGDVLVGDPPRPASEPDARRACSYLPQRVTFPESLTGREIVDFYGGLRRAPAGRADEVLRLSALNGASHRAVATYSGGMVQRLGLAVAMVAGARVLLLDEPTAALDSAGLEAFYTLVEHLKTEGRHTVLFTTHQLGDVEQLADRFAVMVEGRLAAVLTRNQLAERLPTRQTLRLHALYRELASTPCDD